MAEEEVVAAAPSSVPSDHKRKLDEIEPIVPASAAEKTHDSDEVPNEDDNDVAPSDSSDAKRPRLDDEKIDGLGKQELANEKEEEEEEEIPHFTKCAEAKTKQHANENGFEAEKSDEPAKLDEPEKLEEEEAPEKIEVNAQAEDDSPSSKESEETVKPEQVEGTTDETDQQTTDKLETADAELGKVESFEAVNGQELAKEDNKEPSDELPQQESEVDDGSTITRRMEVPNAKVGVLIGKAGDTIRYLQYNSGAKIQIMRDSDADRDAPTRPVEIIGTLSSILKAEKLIDAVIAEADAGGSPSLVARGLATTQAAGAADQIEIQVRNEKVGLIIGRGGETIKGLQTRSGARIQLIPQHLPEGDGSKERTVRVTGDKKQIDIAREMIKEVMNQILGTFSMGSALLSWCSNRQPLSPFIH